MSQLHARVRAQAHADPRGGLPDPEGRLEVPWQVYTLEGLALTVHYATNALHEVIGLRLEQDDAQVRVTVLERRKSHRLPGQIRAQTTTLGAPVGTRRVIDGATGRVRKRFVVDAEAGWQSFDHAALSWIVAGERTVSLRLAAQDALADGCESPALERLAAGDHDALAGVFSERGRTFPTRTEAAVTVVDAEFAAAASAPDPSAEAIGWAARDAVEHGSLPAALRAQLAPILAAYRELYAPETSDEGRFEEVEQQIVELARDLHARGGLRGV